LPFLAAASFTLLFTLGARRSEDRFLLPQTVFLMPYAALIPARAWNASGSPQARAKRGIGLTWTSPQARAKRGIGLTWTWARLWIVVVAAAMLVPAVIGVASMDGTLVYDARYEAERFLARIPAGTRVEVLGASHFLPRLPPGLIVARPGTDAIDDRQRMPGVTEIVDPAMDPRPRAPEWIIVGTAFSNPFVIEPALPPERRPYGSAAYHDEASHRLFRGLLDGSLGYTRQLVARCNLPWPLECRFVHDATGRDVWIYSRVPPPALR
jgi:hypothetical protein